MSTWVALTVFATVLSFSVFVLRASGAWRVLFSGGANLAVERSVNPLASSPRGWIENHAFWDLVDDIDHQSGGLDAEQAFWGEDANRDVG